MKFILRLVLFLLVLACGKDSKVNNASYKKYNDLLVQTEKTIYADTARTHFLLKQSTDLKSENAVAGLLVKCQILSFKGDNVKCDSLAKIAMKIAKETNDTVGQYFANSFLSDKDIVRNKNKFSVADYYGYYKSTKTGDPKFHEEVLHDLINIQLSAKNYDEVKKYLSEQHDLAKKLNDSVVWYGYFSNKSIELFEKYGQDSIMSANTYIDKAIAICPKWKHLDYYIALSNKDWLKGHNDLAGIQRNIAASIKYNYFDVADYTNIIGYYYNVGDAEKCLYYFTLIEHKCINNQDYENLIYMYNHLSNLYIKLDQYEKALFYYKKKQFYSEKLGELETRQEIEELETIFKAKETNTLLQREKQINIALTILALMLLAALLVFWVVSLKKKKAAHQRYLEIIKKLEKQEEQLPIEHQVPQINTEIPTFITDVEKAVPKVVEEELIEKIAIGLNKLERAQMFLRPDFKATVVAQRLGTNTNYLSQYFTQEKKKTFPEYTQELRINYVLNRLKNDKIFRKFTLQAIAEEIGYKNAATFVRIFKAQTGISPSFYIEEINKQP